MWFDTAMLPTAHVGQSAFFLFCSAQWVYRVLVWCESDERGKGMIKVVLQGTCTLLSITSLLLDSMDTLRRDIGDSLIVAAGVRCLFA